MILDRLKDIQTIFTTMAYIPQSAELQGAAQSGPFQNPGNAAPPPVIIMVPTPAPVKEKIPYEKRFPKKFMLTLSSIQLAMAILAIITQAIGLSARRPDLHFVGAGIWCGVFFALSGVFGTIASTKPSFGWIVTFWKNSDIAAKARSLFLNQNTIIGNSSSVEVFSWI